MKIFKRFFIAVVSVISLTSIVGCSSDDMKDIIQENTITLETPSYLRIEGNYLKWNPVLHSTGYIVSVNGAEYHVDDTNYAIDKLKSAEYSFKVKAIGDDVFYKTSIFSDEYKIELEDGAIKTGGYYSQFDELTKNESFLGYGFDVINSSVFSDRHVLTSNPIFDKNGLMDQRLVKVDSKRTDITEIKSSNMDEFISSWNASLNVDVSWGRFFTGGSVDLAAKYSGGYEKAQSKFYQCLSFTEQKYYIVMQGGLSNYREILSSDFEKDLYDATISPANLFRKYGTHFITSAVMGGKIYSHYLLSSEEEKNMHDVSAQLSVEVRKFPVNVDVDVSGGYKQEARKQNIDIKNTIEILGGGDFRMTSDEDINKNYEAWLKSLNDHSSLIGIKDAGSLWPIWDLIDASKDTPSFQWIDFDGTSRIGTRSQQLQSFFEKYGLESYNYLLESVGIKPLKVVEEISDIRINNLEPDDTGIYTGISGVANKISFTVTPWDADYKTTISLGTPTTYARINENNELEIDSNCPSGELIEIVISAGNISKKVKIQVVSTYVCKFNSRGGSSVSAQILNEYDFIEEPKIPYREGYVFEGWYSSPDYIYKWDFDKDYIENNMTLYAKWINLKEIDNPEIIITFSTGDTNVYIEPITILVGQKIDKYPVPTIDGYIFCGWYRDKSLKIKVDDDVYTTSTTLYAYFKSENFNNFSGGVGTITNPYLISNATELYNINLDLNACYKLINNIDLKEYKDWQSIGGNYKNNKMFNGTLDGDGYKILNLQRKADIAEKESRIYFGLFGRIGANGVVKNIIFDGVDVAMTGPAVNNAETNVFCGTVAGALYGKVDNIIINTGSFSYNCCTNGVAFTGAIAGTSIGARISNCTNKIKIVSGRYAGVVGGMSGYASGSEFINCTNNGDLQAWCTGWGGSAWAGGIVGEAFNKQPCTYYNCKNSGNIKANYYSWSIIGCSTGTNIEQAHVVSKIHE